MKGRDWNDSLLRITPISFRATSPNCLWASVPTSLVSCRSHR